MDNPRFGVKDWDEAKQAPSQGNPQTAATYFLMLSPGQKAGVRLWSDAFSGSRNCETSALPAKLFVHQCVDIGLNWATGLLLAFGCISSSSEALSWCVVLVQGRYH